MAFPLAIFGLSSQDTILYLHATANVLLAVGYYLCFFGLLVLLRKRKDLGFRWAFGFFALFFFYTGTTQVLHHLSAWFPIYNLTGGVKLASAVFLIAALVFLNRMLHAALKLPHPRTVENEKKTLTHELSSWQEKEKGWTLTREKLESDLLQKNGELGGVRKKLGFEEEQHQKTKSVLQNRDHYFERLNAEAFDLLLVSDKAGIIIQEGSSLKTILGYPENTFLKKPFSGFVHPDDRQALKNLLTAAASSAGPGREETMRLLHQNGSWRFCRMRFSPWADETGNSHCLMHACDITDRVENEQALQRLYAIMEEVSRTGDFYSALNIAVRRICEAAGWKYAEAWVPRQDGSVLESSPVWFGAGPLEGLRRISRELRFTPNMDLPGKVWHSRKSLVIQNLSASSASDSFYSQMAQELGLKGVLGVPLVTQENQVLAVLIFLMPEYPSPGDRWLNLIKILAIQLASLMQHKSAEEYLRSIHEQMEKKIRERTESLEKNNADLQKENERLKQTEGHLRTSWENFSTLVNSLDGIVWEYDLEAAKFSFVSQQTERILGYPASVWSSEPGFWEDHIHGQDREAVLAFRARVIKEKKDGKWEYRMITAAGSTIWLRDMVSVVVESDRVVKLRGVTVNITEPKQVEEALSQERNFVTTVLDTASALVLILDAEGRIVRFNRVCQQISGYSVDEARDKYFWELLSVPEETERVQTIFKRLLAGQYPSSSETGWVAKDGSRRMIAWSNTVLVNRSGVIVNVIATGVDVTKAKETEQQLKKAVADLARSNTDLDKFSRGLKEANEQLRRLDVIKSNFISAASHELRTPLTSIKGYLETVLQEEAGTLNDQQKEFLGYVKESTERLHRLLNELLDISKIESGQVRMNMALTNIRDLLTEEILMFKKQAHDKNINMDIETDIHLREIHCDADKIREVMDNLLSNAVKYTLAGGRIKVAARNDEKGLQIDVRDTGIGIKEEDLDKIFEPFQHIPKDGVDTEESTGLGLTLVKRIIQVHGGEIRVKSQPGKGSVFTVILPDSPPSEILNNPLWAGVAHD